MQEEGTAFLREGYIVVAPDNQPNERHIRRLNDGQLDGARIRFEFVDNRLASTDQRNLFFALLDAVGMGRDRNHIDHTKHRLMALCRDHHTEYHKIGSVAFAKKYLIIRLGIRLNADDLKKIGVRGDYEQTTN